MARIRLWQRVALFLGSGIWLYAQVETGRISGTVRDASGAVIPGAEVSVVHLQTNRRWNSLTDDRGHYMVPVLPVGSYQVTAELPGFKRTLRSGVRLEVGQTAVVDLVLEVGEVTDQVEVIANASLLEASSASQGEVIDNRKIVDLPLNGRDYIQLALLSSGAVQPIGGRFGGFSASGQRITQNNYLIDGIDNNNLQSAAQGRRAETVKPSIDSIQEFQVVTNLYSAEYGRAAGGVVNLTLKSGSNELHGTLYEFHRNEILDAKNFFDPPDRDKPPFKRNQFGFSLGGPIVRNKTFFFGDYEGTRIRESRTVNNTIPTARMRRGDFSELSEPIFDPATYDPQTGTRQPFPNNLIPESRMDPVARKAADWYPDPQNDRLTQNFLFNPPNRENRDRFNLRIDHVFSEKDNVYYRLSYDLTTIPGSPNLPPPAFGGGNATDFEHRGINTGLVWNHVFSPALVTSNRLGWNRLFTERTSPISSNAASELGLRGVDQELAGAPLFSISGYTNLGLGPDIPNLAGAQTRQVKSDTTWIRGAHTVKFGGDLLWLQNNLNNPKLRIGEFVFNGAFSRNPKGNVGGDPFADFLLGFPVQANVSNEVFMALRTPFLHFYLQDEWKATSRLTLTLGLRYEVFFPWVESFRDAWTNFDMEANPDQPPLVLARPGGSRRERALVDTDANNFAPRLGFAYQWRKGTVLRGGYGIFYANWDPPGGGRLLQSNPPFHVQSRRSTDSITPTLSLREGIPGSPVSPGFSPEMATDLQLSSIERTQKWPYSQQWSLNIQQELARDWLWEVGYFGSKSQHLLRRGDINFAPPGPGNINDRRRYRSIVWPGTDLVLSPLSDVIRLQYDGDAQFHSLQTKLKKRFSSGFSLLTSYMFSRTIGDTCGVASFGNAPGCSPQDLRNLRLEKALDNQHIKHRSVTSVIWELPVGRNQHWGSAWNSWIDAVLGGWSMASILTFSSGQPMTPTVRGNPANSSTTNRPNLVGDPLLPRSERTLDRWFNTDVLVRNERFQFGSAGRNILFQPGFGNWDFALYKRFRIREETALQFRFEAFNFTNTPPFNAPNAQVGNRNFGRITSAGRPRNLQFGLKLIF